MELETLSCNNCGAPLQVPLTANYVNCAHCGSRLAVKRTESTHYTEVLERLDQLDTRTQTVEAEVRVLRLDNAIKDLDEEWLAKREHYMVRDRDGSLSEPGLGKVAFYLLVLFVAVIASPIIIASNDLLRSIASSGGALIFGLIILALAVGVIWVSIDEYRNLKAYSTLKASYQAQRNALLSERRHAETAVARGDA